MDAINMVQRNQNVIDDFHLLYYNSKGQTWMNTYWLGVPIQKLPLDLWVYQEIIFDIKPDIIIETGTADGGSALFLANICDMIGKGRIVTVDIVSKPRPVHSRITYILGSSISDNTFTTVSENIQTNDKVLVILDSNHNKDHVTKEIALYSKLVSIGSYLIIEDSNINGHPVLPRFGPGPMEASEEFLKENKSFIWDITKEKFFLTHNPKGYLMRIS
jgi:cephalosporin hydroxylase